MQFAKFEIQLGGEMANTVIRDGITPPETLILQLLHGTESVRPIEITAERMVKPVEEMERLLQRFKTKNASNALNSIFPGARPVNMPVNFEDIGLDDIPFAEDATINGLVKKGMSSERAKQVVDETSKRVSAEEKAVKEEEKRRRQKEAEETAGAAAKTSSKQAGGGKSKPAPTKQEDKFEENVKFEYDDDDK